MSATNLTKNLKLPQFVASDKPSWLGDVNGAMKNIDDGIGVIKGDITKASDTASSAKSQSDANTVTLGNVNAELTNIGNRVTALEAGGGTEQLEQRLQTVESDVEALQTRADTFEEEIASNGTNITNLTKRVTDVESKSKTNADNITSLQTTTSSLLDTAQENSGKITSLTNTVDTQGKRLTTTEITASNAFNKSQENGLAIGDLTTQISNKSSLSCSVGSLMKVGSTNIYTSNAFFAYDGETNIIFVFEIAILNHSLSTTKENFATLNLSGLIPSFPNKTFVFNEVTIPTNNGNVIIGAEKGEGLETVTFNLRRAVSSQTLNTTITVITNGIIY